MARKYLIQDKRGVIRNHQVAKRNLNANYKVIGEAKWGRSWRMVYRKTYIEQPNVVAKSRKYKLRQLKTERERAVTGTPEEAMLVEVKGLVSGEYKRKEHYFHCEMLFYWWGRPEFNEKLLLEKAYDVMLNALPEIDRIAYELITSEHFGPDFQRWGIESVAPVPSGIFEQMEFEVFIPGSRTGRVLYTNYAWVSV